MSDWAEARSDIKTAVLANSSVPTARVNLERFNSDPADWDTPAKDFSTPFNSVWMVPQVDSVPAGGPLFVGEEAMHFRRGILTLEFYFIPGTGDSDHAAAFNPICSALNRSIQGIVEFDDFDEPDDIGLIEDGSWYRVDLQCGFYLQQDITQGASLAQFLSVQSSPAAHGFAVGDAVGFNDSTTQWQKVIATTAGATNISQVGVVFHVGNADDFMVALPGATVRMTAHGFGTGALFVDQSTAGAITNTAPTSGVEWRLGSAPDANRVTLGFEQPIGL